MRVAHWRKKGDRQTRVKHSDLAAKYCLVAAVTVEIDNVPKFVPSFVPMPKKDAVSGLAGIKEALMLPNDCDLRQITGSRITRTQADGGGEFNNQNLKDLCFEKNIVLSFSSAHQPLSNGIAKTMVGVAQNDGSKTSEASTLGETMVVTRVQVCRTHDARKDPWQNMDMAAVRPMGWHLEKKHDKDQAKSIDDRGAVGTSWTSTSGRGRTTRILQYGIVVFSQQRVQEHCRCIP